MDLINDATQLVRMVTRYSILGGAPEEVKSQLENLVGSPADKLTAAPEILYAHFDQLDDEGKELTAHLFRYADEQGWSTFNRNGRSAAIVSLVRRELGETGAGVADEDAAWPEPEKNRRDGLDWRTIGDEPAPAPEPPADEG